jgi:hypothetical protein
MERPLRGLNPDERLVTRVAASFRGAAAASVRATFAMGSARKRLEAYSAWRMHAEAVGFPAAGPEMVVGLTSMRLIVCDTTFWLGRPGSIHGSIAFTRIAQVATHRSLLVTSLAFAFTGGEIVEIESMHGRRLRGFADAVRGALDAAPGVVSP